MAFIEYFGHSCFRLTADGGYQIVFDPYNRNSVPGIELPEDLSADEVSVSHGHEDHNAEHLITLVRSGAGSPFSKTVITVPHDDAGGAKRGMNQISLYSDADLRIAHFGDIGRVLNLEESKILKDLDVAMIPCGGFYTIDAHQVRMIIESIKPKLTILMHFRTETSGYSMISSLEEVKKEFPSLRELGSNRVEIGAESGVIALKYPI